ncbi:molybdenum cofactor guanylyltransferase [Paenibacillus sp. GD4]|jgi:molybdenum cofactor guanylyltransferase|uniref:molybdenum cofactor guanylyltransferase n=1 Tax=Paenibacillus sp. GD4 TaxID=3068890 RepID=UPI0027964DD2|nr:molybdenum cofactor guanylyltransferase [Paenibacillus sp. GD4]MDQ1909913.1 molybdenum cofactor guanylyltransferase [Paenibacillus sp. GD4]
MMSGLILAGGRNRGTNGEHKAFLVLDNMTFVERQIREMKKICKEIIIVTNDPIPFLRKVDRGVRIITDYFPGKGPLSGMHAGLTLAQHPNVWVVGCDMPYISAKAAELLIERKQDGFEAVIPWVNHSAYPLHGVYDRSCAAAIGQLLEKDEVAVSALLKQLFWCELQQSAFEEKGIDTRFVAAIKTTEEYEKLLAWHDSLKMNYLYGG